MKKFEVLPDSLTKENFWNELNEKFPEQMKVFCDWIDEYKKRVNWNMLFGHTGYISQQGRGPDIAVSYKFHEIPLAMQIGIFIQFVVESKSSSDNFIIIKNDSLMNFITAIEDYFKGVQTDQQLL